jgi:hypothetical protein
VVVVLAAFAACSPVVDDARPEVSAPEPLAGEPLAAESLAPEVVLHPAPEPATVPLYGGTMERFGVDGVVAADPAGDVVVFVDFERTIEIPTGRFTQPFRLLAEDGGVWVTLRGSGEVARVEPDAAAVVRRSWVCPEPRGLERIPDGPLVVACASGELVALDDQGRPERTVLLATDLRDVAYADDRLYVSRFRAAEVLEVDPWTLAERGRAGFGRHANTAWRMRAGGAGGVLVLHQRGSGKVIEEDAEPVPDDSGLVDVDVDGVVSSSPYGGGGHSECRSVQQAAISRVRFGVATTGPQLAFVAVGVDFVEARQGIHVVGSSVNGPLVSDFGTADSVLAAGGCAMPTARRGAPGSDGIGAAVVVSGGRVWVQGAEPAGVGGRDGQPAVAVFAPRSGVGVVPPPDGRGPGLRELPPRGPGRRPRVDVRRHRGGVAPGRTPHDVVGRRGVAARAVPLGRRVPDRRRPRPVHVRTPDGRPGAGARADRRAVHLARWTPPRGDHHRGRRRCARAGVGRRSRRAAAPAATRGPR